MSFTLRHLALATLGLAGSLAALAQPIESARPPAVIPLQAEAAAALLAYAPLPEALARGVVIIQFRTENTRLMPVFGANAVDVSPRLGHLHVSVDDWQGTWAHTSPDPIILVGLKPGPHTVRLEIADPSHAILASTVVAVTVPTLAAPQAHSH